MRRLSLSSLLILINAGLVLVVVMGVAAGAVGVLRQLAERHALARVDLAAQSAAAAIERAGNRVLASAQLEADRAALGRLLSGGDRAALADWLERFRRTSDLTGCALFAGGTLLASAGRPLPWEALRRVPAGRSLVTGDGGTLILGGSAALAATPQVEALTALALDEAYGRLLSRQVGLAVAVMDSREAGRASAPASAVRERALAAGTAGGALAVGRVDAAGLYVADRPLLGPAGDVLGLVEARLPAASVDGSVAKLIERLMVLALSVAALATLASTAAGRWLGRPVKALTAAAARLGRGDLTTPIGRAPGLELGTLAATLEETRRQLLRLTAELRRRQAEGAAVLTGIAEGVVSVDPDRRIRYLNPQAAALLGTGDGQALGRFCGDVLNPRGPGGERPCENSCPIVHARFRGSARATEHLQLAGDQRRSVVITSSGPVEQRQFLVLRDETDIEVVRRQRDAVLANISHEFKTPLAAQRASLELLREKLLGESGESGESGKSGGRGESREDVARGEGGEDGASGEGRESAEVQELVLSLERGGLRLTQLIDNLLESVRIESGRDNVRKRPVALDEVAEEAVELTAPLFAQRRQRVRIDLPYPLPPVLGDAPRLTQVFVNLLANAHKFAPAGSALVLGGETTDRTVTLWVDDEGPGLPATSDSGRELFQRFVRSPGGMGEPEQSGMGLGLWIVQSIVERHGGSVAAERRHPGTRIRVTLPRADAGATAAADGGGAGREMGSTEEAKR